MTTPVEILYTTKCISADLRARLCVRSCLNVTLVIFAKLNLNFFVFQVRFKKSRRVNKLFMEK